MLGLYSADEHANHAGAIHGGLLATLCDLAVGYAVRAPAEDDISGAATVSLTTDPMAPARPGRVGLLCERTVNGSPQWRVMLD